jgi:hypothetical protein
LAVAATIWHNYFWARLQRRVARQRPSFDRDAFAEELARSGVSSAVAAPLYDAVAELCVKGVAPHPDDSLTGFYFDDPEDMEDLIAEMFDRLELPTPSRYAPEASPHLESLRSLSVYLQSKLANRPIPE